MPTAPPIMQRLPMIVLPEMPAQPAIDRVRADAAVMADLHLVVQLDAVTDDRVFDRAAVDRGVRADLDVAAEANAAEMRHLHVAVAVGREAEALGADDRARLERAARPDHRAAADA